MYTPQTPQPPRRSCNSGRKPRPRAGPRGSSAHDDTAERSPRVLVIDDSPTVICAIRQALESSSLVVDTVDHYLEIPRYLRLTPPDLVILDLSIPFLSGERISEFIRREQQRDTPILIYSSLPVKTMRTIATRIDAAGWVSKGDSMAELIALVEDTLAARGGKKP